MPKDGSSGICAPHIPMSEEWLYPTGSDFHKTLKEAKAAKILTDKKKIRLFLKNLSTPL
jgi:hypothetical protein